MGSEQSIHPETLVQRGKNQSCHQTTTSRLLGFPLEDISRILPEVMHEERRGFLGMAKESKSTRNSVKELGKHKMLRYWRTEGRDYQGRTEDGDYRQRQIGLSRETSVLESG